MYAKDAFDRLVAAAAAAGEPLDALRRRGFALAPLRDVL